MNDLLYDDLDNLIEEIINSDDFKRLKELKYIIDNKYIKDILKFKRCESLYNDALPNFKYYSNFEEIKLNLSNAKNILYSYPEVKEYLSLEKKLNTLLISISNDIASTMSNKFKTIKQIK